MNDCTRKAFMYGIHLAGAAIIPIAKYAITLNLYIFVIYKSKYVYIYLDHKD
jgi:hypothetical protein